MPMPLDITVITKDGKESKFNIPIDLMRGEKMGDRFFSDFKVVKDWPWTHPTYSLTTGINIDDVSKVFIDQSGRLADVDRSNNVLPRVAKLEDNSK